MSTLIALHGVHDKNHSKSSLPIIFQQPKKHTNKQRAASDLDLPCLHKIYSIVYEDDKKSSGLISRLEEKDLGVPWVTPVYMPNALIFAVSGCWERFIKLSMMISSHNASFAQK